MKLFSIRLGAIIPSKNIMLLLGIIAPNLILRTSIFAQSENSKLELKKTIRSYYRPKFHAILGANYKAASVINKDFLLKYPIGELEVDLFGFCLELDYTTTTSTNNLYYTLNQKGGFVTQYKYSLYTIGAKIGYLIKTVNIGTQLMNIRSGLSISQYYVNQVDVNSLKSLYSPADFIQIQMMDDDIVKDIYITLDFPFWIKNAELNIRLVGYIPLNSDRESTELYYQPKYRNWFELGINYNLRSIFKTNPLKMKIL